MSDSAESQQSGAARIIIVDDQASHAEILSDALAAVGHDCFVATTIEEARDLLRKNGADIVITDLVLGDRDGLDLIREAQAIDPFIAVVVVTGHGTVETAVEAMQLGAVDYLRKPVDLAGLRIRVNRALEGLLLRGGQKSWNEPSMTGSVLKASSVPVMPCMPSFKRCNRWHPLTPPC